MAPKGSLDSVNRDSSTATWRVPYPTNRDNAVKTISAWMEGKKVDDGVPRHLWRVHDKLYDLSDFVKSHPGGKFWLDETRGLDITEAFESAHVNPIVYDILPKFYVKDADTPRNSPYTFKEDGFHRTLKKKVWPLLKRHGTGPSLRMLVIQDLTVAVFLFLMLLAAYSGSALIAIAAGIVLSASTTMSHNFFHQADNFRIFYFDLSFFSSAEWRISHAISHHLYTNTLYDYEIIMFEPFLNILPDPRKSWIMRITSPVICHVMMLLTYHIALLTRVIGWVSGETRFRWENLLPAVEVVAMAVVAEDMWSAFRLHTVMMLASSMLFAYVGLTAAHHHPDIYHAYDTFRKEPDWGLCQLDAVRDRVETTGSLFLVTATFGDHTLHHLLPTIDHSKLPMLYPALIDTCRQFNVPFTFLRQAELCLGFYRQLTTVKPNTDEPGYKKEYWVTGKDGKRVPLMAKSVMQELAKAKHE